MSFDIHFIIVPVHDDFLSMSVDFILCVFVIHFHDMVNKMHAHIIQHSCTCRSCGQTLITWAAVRRSVQF